MRTVRATGSVGHRVFRGPAAAPGLALEAIDRPWLAHGGRPADEVVSQHRALQPGAVGAEVARRHMLQAGALLQVADGELDHGVVAVEHIDLDGVADQIGEEGEMAPVRPQRSLAAVGQAGAAHDEAPCVVGALRHLGDAASGVVDVHPGVLGDGGDGGVEALGVGAHRHRVAHVEAPEAGNGVV